MSDGQRTDPIGFLWGQRIHEPERQQFAVIENDVGAASTVLPFVVPTPDARVQVRVAITISPAVPGPEIPYDVTFGGLNSTGLWLAAAVRDANGQFIPVTNIVGTRAAPLSIPTDVSEMGYSQTILTDADVLIGELTVEAQTGEIGSLIQRWELVCRYQPVSGALFSEPEWRQIVARCTPTVNGDLIVLGGA